MSELVLTFFLGPIFSSIKNLNKYGPKYIHRYIVYTEEIEHLICLLKKKNVFSIIKT